MSVLVITPTYNERRNLTSVVEGVLAHEGYRLMVVDDDSPDGTGDLADELASRFAPRLVVVHRKQRRGLGSAYRHGISLALETTAEFICQMDADLSHDPAYLPRLVEAAQTADVVIGSRYTRGISVVNWPLRRLFLSTAANWYIRTVAGLYVRDCTSGYRCWRRDALAVVASRPLRSEGYAFLVDMLVAAHYAGFRISEVPIIFVERREGASKLSKRVMLESVFAPWRAVIQHRVVGRGRRAADAVER